MTDSNEGYALCDTYWGSHGCDLVVGHNGLHESRTFWGDEEPELCSSYDDETKVTYFQGDGQ